MTADTLTAFAGIAIAITGFSGVVVALPGKTSEKFTELERLNFRILLQVSSLALFFSLFPLVLFPAFGTDLGWQIAMLVYGVSHLVDTAYFSLKTSHVITRSATQRLAPIIGVAIAISQLAVGALGPTQIIESLYFFTLLWHLAVAGMGFVKSVFASRDKDETPGDTAENVQPNQSLEPDA